MKIFCLFRNPSDPDLMPWCIDATDEYTVEECGFTDEYEKLKAHPDVREIVISVPDSAITQLFKSLQVGGKVVS